MTKEIRHLSIGLLMPCRLADQSVGASVFRLMEKLCPELFPERYGHDAPLTEHIEGGNILPFLESMRPIVMWQGTASGLECIGFSGDDSRHSGLFIWGSPKGTDIVLIRDFCLALSSERDVDVGWLHVLTSAEFDAKRANYWELLAPLNSGFTTHNLQGGLPDLTWGMVLGQPYVHLIGRQRLLTAPVHDARVVGESVYLQLTPEIADVYEDYDSFVERREQVKRHLGYDIFRDTRTGDPAGRVATFRLRID